MNIGRFKPGEHVRIGTQIYEVIEHQISGTRVRLTNTEHRVHFIRDDKEVDFVSSLRSFVISSGSEVAEILHKN